MAAHDMAALERLAKPRAAAKPAATLAEIVATRIEELTRYQDAAYAKRYEALVRRVEQAESRVLPGHAELTAAVARYGHKLMAYKDEYEVARLYSAPEFRKALDAQFEDWRTLEFHLAPPLVAERDPRTGRLKKRSFGPWMLTAFALLAKLKGLRGTRLDLFGRTEERRTERRLIVDYEALVAELCTRLSPANHALAIELASIPEQIRGYGHVKEEHLRKAKAREAELLRRLRADAARPVAVAAE
jgi:indolepyruvate ferredoxin oxidoreductase